MNVLLKEFELRVRSRIKGDKICNPADVAGAADKITCGRDREIFLVFLLNIKNEVIGYIEAARGSVDACPVDVREVFRAAVLAGASGIICAHNHPSGDGMPSKEDRVFTDRIKLAAQLLGIQFLDHVIVSATNGYYSFTDTTYHKYA